MARAEQSWVRRATSQEAAFHAFTLQSSHVISYVLRVATSRPLHEEDVRSALSILQKKTPTLRIVFAEKDDGELWLKEKVNDIDFQVVQDTDIREWHMEMSRRTFQADGPLWAARFLPWSPSHAAWVAATEMEDVDGTGPDVPHLSHVILSFHHGITDGYSCLRIISHFLKFLNEVIAGKPPVDADPIAQIIDVQEQNRVREEVENSFKSNRLLLDEGIKLLENLSTHTLIENSYPCQYGASENMHIILHMVSRASTVRFRSRCKAEGVTFHAAFCTVIHAAIVKMVTQSSPSSKERIQDTGEIDIPSAHALNARRYYNDGSRTAFGLGMKGFGATVCVPIDIMENFWSHARKFHEDLVYSNQVKAGFHDEVIANMTGHQSLPELITHSGGSPLPKMRYYVTSNMMDVTPVLDAVGDNVRLVFYDRSTYMPRFPALFLTNFQTFRRQLVHSMQYNTQFLSHDAAEMMSKTIFEIYEQIAE